MRVIKKNLVLCALFTGLCNWVFAATNPECLEHLGGGYSDAECFAGLRIDIVRDNKKLYDQIASKIPGGNAHKRLLDQYMAAQDNAVKFCQLQRDAGSRWETNPAGSMYPALYQQCVYELRKEQNRFLRGLSQQAEQ